MLTALADRIFDAVEGHEESPHADQQTPAPPEQPAASPSPQALVLPMQDVICPSVPPSPPSADEQLVGDTVTSSADARQRMRIVSTRNSLEPGILYGMKRVTFFRVEVSAIGRVWTVEWRFRQFLELHKRTARICRRSGLPAPKLPPKLRTHSAAAIAKRLLGLDAYLQARAAALDSLHRGRRSSRLAQTPSIARRRACACPPCVLRCWTRS
jgi:hypothetical protein